MADRVPAKKIDLAKLYTHMDDRLTDGYLAAIRKNADHRKEFHEPEPGPGVETLRFPSQGFPETGE